MEITPRGIQVSTIQEQVYQELFHAIVTGKLKPGEKITIEAIAELMKVSLMPVRIAVQKLSAGGLLTIGTNRRITVAKLTPDGLLEILEIRLLLEGFAAERACALRSEESLEKLERLYQQCVKAPDAESYLRSNQELHLGIYAEARMPVLNELIASLWDRVNPYLYILFGKVFDGRDLVFHANHRGMLDALKARDAKAIRKWLTTDLTNAANLVKREFGQAGRHEHEQTR